MTRLLTALTALLLAACAAQPPPYEPVRDVVYQAMGWNPGWQLAVGDGQILLRQAGAGDRSWPRVLPRMEDGVRIWQSGDGADEITITAQPGPCQSSAPAESAYVYNYEHHVAVSVGDLELRGCGGRMIERVERR